jgi:hypothetical protein
MTTAPKLALTLGDDDIIIDYTPNEIEGVTVQEILDKVKEDTSYFTIDKDSKTGKFYLTPGGEGPAPLTLTNAEGRNVMLNGTVTIDGDPEDGILAFASQYLVHGIAPSVEEHPYEEGKLRFTVDALYWEH